MSNRNRTTLPQRLPILSDNDRIILNIYLNMYNQTVRDIEQSYQHIDLLYNNLDLLYNSLENTREIINTITGVTNTINTTTSEQENPSSFRTFLRPTTQSYYTADENNLSLPSRLYLVDFARRLLSSYNNDDTSTTTNRETEERDRRRVRQRTEVNTRRRQNATATDSNAENINLDYIVSGITRPRGRLIPGLSTFYDNVPIYPSEEQITNGTRRLLFSSIDIPLNISCPITLERFENDTEVLQILGCRHIFNPTSLQRWFQNNVRCPICRYDIRDYIPISNRRRRYYRQEEEPTQEETKEDEEEEQTAPTMTSSQTSGSTLRTNTPEPEPRTSVPEPTDDRSEFITNLTSVTENLLTDLISSSFPNNNFSFNGTTYSVDVSNNEIVFQGYILPNQDE